MTRTKTIRLSHAEVLDIRNAIGYRLYKVEEYLPLHKKDSAIHGMYTTEHAALSKLKGALDTGKDVVVLLPHRHLSTQDQALAYLYAQYDKTIVGAYIYVFTKNGGTWDYFNHHDWTLDTALLDEDFIYYRDSMYPEGEEYDDINIPGATPVSFNTSKAATIPLAI